MHKSGKEEYIAAMQNIGSVMFFIGVFCCCMAVDVLTAIVCFMVSAIGFLLIVIAERMMDKLEQKEKQKNKCHRTAKHIDTYH